MPNIIEKFIKDNATSQSIQRAKDYYAEPVELHGTTMVFVCTGSGSQPYRILIRQNNNQFDGC